jgi:hypothetical protein
MELPADGDVVFVPARPARGVDEREPAIELRRLAGTDERVGLAFSTLPALVARLGPFQPWVGLPMYAYVAWLAIVRRLGIVHGELTRPERDRRRAATPAG